MHTPDIITWSCRTLFAGLLLASQAMAQQQQPAAETDMAVAEEWSHAASDRQLAAMSQQAEAEELVRIAQELRKKEYLYELDRKNNLNRAGELEMKAGELHFLAAQNHEKAATDWGQAAREYRRIREREKERQAAILVEQSTTRAIDALTDAAEAYELSAEAYGSENAADNIKSAVASDRAAGCRELLATKRPVRSGS